MRQDLNALRNDHNKLQNQLAPRTRARVLKSMMTSPLDAAITTIAKKYALFYHLWVPSGVFPLHTYPTDFDFNNPTRYHSSETKTTAYSTKIYLMLPVSLQTQATKYEQFEQLVSDEARLESAIKLGTNN